MNMKSEYRRELKTLDRAQRKLDRDLIRFNRSEARKILAIKRGLDRALRSTDRELGRISKRRAILEARLAS